MSLFKWLPGPETGGNKPRQLPPVDRTSAISQAAFDTKAASERTLALLAMLDFAKGEIETLQRESERVQKLMDTLQAFVTVVEEQCR